MLFERIAVPDAAARTAIIPLRRIVRDEKEAVG